MLTKRASDPNDSETTFEQSFSDIAHTYIQDKAPRLMEHEIGFQLVDRDEDGTKALGVMGFKVGKNWVYAPVFFLNGALKGHELMYLKQQDMFVPLDDGWVNYILKRKPNVLGSGVDKNLSRLGVLPPHLYQYSRSPNKYASAMPDWYQAVLPDIAHWITSDPLTDPKYADIPSMPEYLKSASIETLAVLKDMFQKFPRLLKAASKHHSINAIVKAMRQAAVKHQSRGVLKRSDDQSVLTTNVLGIRKSAASENPVDNGTLKIVRVKDVEKAKGSVLGPAGMEGKQRETLIREQVVITDNRSEVTRAYRTETTMQFNNPDQTGLYEVLLKPFKFEKCLVVMSPYGRKRRESFCTVVKIEKDGNRHEWINTHPSNVWVGQKIEGKEYDEWFAGLPDADSLPSDEKSKSNRQLLITKTGEGTTPFKVHRQITKDDLKSYEVYYEDYARFGRADHLSTDGDCRLPDYQADDDNRDPVITLTGNDSNKMRRQRGELFVPAGTKRVPLDYPATGDDEPCERPFASMTDLRPGNLSDVEMYLFNKYASLRVHSDGGQVTINNQPFSQVEGLVHLVSQHGLTEKEARQILDEAKRHRTENYRLKYASPYDRMNMGHGPSVPAIPDQYTGMEQLMGGSVQSNYPQEFNLPIDDMSARHTDPNVYNLLNPMEPNYGSMGDDSSQLMMDATQTGQKEVLDTATLGTLLKSTSDENMIDRHLGGLISGMDRLGRLLFSMRWHYDAWEDRFGKEDAHALEDSMVNTFQGIGDIVLKLKEKSLRPEEEDPGKIDLKALAES